MIVPPTHLDVRLVFAQINGFNTGGDRDHPFQFGNAPMNLFGTSLLLLFFMATDDKPVQSAPKFPIGKDTTYVTGPLDSEGYIDYEAALNDRLGKDITSEKNANLLLWKAIGPTPDDKRPASAEFFRRLGIEQPPARGDYLIGLIEFAGNHLKLDHSEIDVFNDQLNRATQRPWIGKDCPYIAAWLKANEKALLVVVEASKRPDYFNPLICQRNKMGRGTLFSAMLPSAQSCRVLAMALAARAMLCVGERKFDGAWQDLLACHRLGRLFARGASLIEGLVGVSIDAIANSADLAYLEVADWFVIIHRVLTRRPVRCVS